MQWLSRKPCKTMKVSNCECRSRLVIASPEGQENCQRLRASSCWCTDRGMLTSSGREANCLRMRVSGCWCRERLCVIVTKPRGEAIVRGEEP